MVDTQGDVVIPVETWKKLLEARERLIERLEDQEDRALLRGWLVRLVGNS